MSDIWGEMSVTAVILAAAKQEVSVATLELFFPWQADGVSKGPVQPLDPIAAT